MNDSNAKRAFVKLTKLHRIKFKKDGLAHMQQIVIDGYQMVAQGGNESASGTPVILLHGINASISFWTSNLPAICTERRWYSLSLPGHYPAQLPPHFQWRDINVENLTRIIACAIQELVGETPVLIGGHSTGGFFSLSVAIHYPEMVKGVMCLAGFSHGRWTGLLGMYQQLVRLGIPGEIVYKLLYRWVKLSPHILGWVLNTYYRGKTPPLQHNPNFKAILAASYADYYPQDLNAMLPYFYFMPEIDITPKLSQIAVPTLVVTGDADPIVSPNQASRIAHEVSNSDLKVIRKAGHVPMWETPQEFDQILTAWVKQQGF